MSRNTARPRPGSDRTSLYTEITDKIIAELEAGRLPWVQPWETAGARAPLAMPQNASTQRRYSGINVLILWGAVIEHGFAGQSWLTFRQALGLGGNVRKGERGTNVVYADRFTPDDERRRAAADGEAPGAIPFLKRFTVFNTDQCDGLPDEIATVAPSPLLGLIEPRVEALIRATGIDFRIGGAQAFYSPTLDFVQVPPPQAYFEPINWHRTALHEISHASGHSSRLGRDLSGSFGSKKYSFEEIIAEISAAYLCASLGITPTVRHADYIGAWLDVLREDDRAIVRRQRRVQGSRLHSWLRARHGRARVCRDGRRRAGGGVMAISSLLWHLLDIAYALIFRARSTTCMGLRMMAPPSAPVHRVPSSLWRLTGEPHDRGASGQAPLRGIPNHGEQYVKAATPVHNRRDRTRK